MGTKRTPSDFFAIWWASFHLCAKKSTGGGPLSRSTAHAGEHDGGDGAAGLLAVALAEADRVAGHDRDRVPPGAGAPEAVDPPRVGVRVPAVLDRGAGDG